MFWATFAYSRSLSVQVILGILSASLALFITGYVSPHVNRKTILASFLTQASTELQYHYLQDPSFHQNAYAILTAIVLFRSIFVMETRIRPQFRRRNEQVQKDLGSSSSTEATRAEEARREQRDKSIVTTMWIMIAFGLSIFLGGFGIWTLDNIYCSKLRSWRHIIGLPWGIVLEGHGWWHLMTGTGAYCYIVWNIWLRHCLNGRQDEFELVWPGWLTLPHVEKVAGTSNGALKKRS